LLVRTFVRVKRVPQWLAVAVFLASCSSETAGPATAEGPFRRLTREEYNNTVRDLLGATTRPADTFPPEEQANGFNNNSKVLGVTQLLAENYLATSEVLADRFTREVNDVLPGCTKLDGEPCARAFIETFGKRAFRRPLTAEEIDRFVALWRTGYDEVFFDEGIEMVVQAMLQSPHFLYRVEVGEPVPGKAGLRRPTPYEQATRLSYLLWGTMPDDELFAAAGARRLSTPEEIEAQARRMMGDPRTRATVGSFFRQWLQLDEINSLDKDTAVFPSFDGKLRPHLRGEIETFIDHVVWEGGGLHDLLTASYTFLNRPLAEYYGVSGPAGDAFERVELDPARHAGILTQAGILASLAKPNQSSPVHRGKWVRERLLCEELMPPPPNVEVTPPNLDPGLTTRERFWEHRASPFCSTCHEMMDPIGLGFEHFDGAGLWRETENGLAIDDSGELVGTDVPGEFQGVVELAHRLADSEQVRDCVTTSWFRFAFGRSEAEADAGSLESLRRSFGDGDVRELVIGATRTDAFLYLPATKEAVK
jgi:hypothetical protein